MSPCGAEKWIDCAAGGGGGDILLWKLRPKQPGRRKEIECPCRIVLLQFVAIDAYSARQAPLSSMHPS